MAKKNKEQHTLPPATAAYAYLDKPDTGHKFSNNKFKVTMVYDDTDFVDAVEELVVQLAQEEWGDKVDIDDVKRPYRLPDEQTKENFEGKATIAVTSKYKPQAYDAKRKKLPSSVKIYSGDVISCIVQLMPYESTEKVREGKKTVTVTVYGVSAQLSAVQLIEKRGGGGADPNAFGEYDDGFDGSEYEDEEDNSSDHEGGESVDDDGDY
jgi:hypothetical protein